MQETFWGTVVSQITSLLPAGMGHEAADAYRELRHIQHRARLDEAPTQIDATQAEPLAAPVRALWAHVIVSGPGNRCTQ